MNTFLGGVEKKAFRMAVLATGNDDDAFDIVQDTMLAFVKSYSSRSGEEWAPLFYRVLQNRITDFHRRSAVRNRFRSWFRWGSDAEDNDDENPLEQVADNNDVSSEQKLLSEEFAASLETALKDMPLRQRQAFLLRAWEGLDTRQTGVAMGCSQGSVKTHYSRAIHALRTNMKEFAP
ncbi:MAG: RNA polymerase sigma factor [Desulfuromonadaceae bacterium]